MRKHIMPVIMLSFLGLIVLSGCSAGKSIAAVDLQKSGVDSGEVYIMAGKIETTEKADIASKINARVAEISVDVGSAVKKGDPIIKLDSKDLEAQAVQAQAGIDQAQAALDGAKASYANAKNIYDKNEQLFNAGAISQYQLDQFQTALDAAETALNLSQSQLKQAQAAFELAQTQLNNGTIVSPISGVITAKKINAGEMAIAGVPLATVVNSDAMIVDAHLPAELRDKVKVGQEVLIKVLEIPNKVFSGIISVIEPVIDLKSNDIIVKVKFIEKDPLLSPGMFAEIGLKN